MSIVQVTRNDVAFADAVASLLEAHPSKAFSIVTTDGKQERGYAPVVIGNDFLQCRSGLDERQNDRVYPLFSIVSIMPS
jgi:hypothetical protein